jgi:hypothetical protein
LPDQPAAPLLEAIADNPDVRPLDLLASALAGTFQGWRRDTMFGCVVAAVMKGLDDETVREALLPVYLDLHAPNEHHACERAFADALRWIRGCGYTERAETEQIRARCPWTKRADYWVGAGRR